MSVVDEVLVADLFAIVNCFVDVCSMRVMMIPKDG